MTTDFSKIKITVISAQGQHNPNNPYDHLSPTEGRARIRELLAGVALKNTHILIDEDIDT